MLDGLSAFLNELWQSGWSQVALDPGGSLTLGSAPLDFDTEGWMQLRETHPQLFQKKQATSPIKSQRRGAAWCQDRTATSSGRISPQTTRQEGLLLSWLAGGVGSQKCLVGPFGSAVHFSGALLRQDLLAISELMLQNPSPVLSLALVKK